MEMILAVPGLMVKLHVTARIPLDRLYDRFYHRVFIYTRHHLASSHGVKSSYHDAIRKLGWDMKDFRVDQSQGHVLSLSVQVLLPCKQITSLYDIDHCQR